MSAQRSRPEMLMVSLAYEASIDELYQPLIHRMIDQANLRRATTGREVFEHLAYHSPDVLVITDEGIVEEKHTDVLHIIQCYTRNGGRTIIALSFPCFVQMDDFDRLFSMWNLPWTRGNYERSEVSVNRTCASKFGLKGLPGTYSLKALKIRHAEPGQILYSERPESPFDAGSAPIASLQGAVVLTSWGAGSFGYVGDVNPESDDVVLSICGFDPVKIVPDRNLLEGIIA